MRSLPEPSGLVGIDGTTAQLSARKAALRRHCAVLPENGVGMPKIVITHNVVDVAQWLGFKSERADAIGALGGSNVVDHVAQDGSNAVAIAAEVDDVAAMLATLSSPPPEVGAIMEKHGVLPPLAIYVEQ